jgi:hypothetical protein
MKNHLFKDSAASGSALALGSRITARASRSPLKLGIALIASAIMLSAFSCNSSDIHKASDAAAKIASGLKAIEKVNEDLYPSQLTVEETVAISKGVAGATLVNDRFVGCVRGLKQSAGNAGLIACFDSLANALNDLNNKSLLGIKNPDARARFALTFQAVEEKAKFIAGAIGYSKPVISSTPVSELESTPQPVWADPRALLAA